MVNDANTSGGVRFNRKKNRERPVGEPRGGGAGGRVGRRSFLKTTGTGVAVAAAAGCLGDLGGSGGGLGDTIKVGAMGPADSPFGSSILRTAELAGAQFNADDGIGGAEVEVITKDTKDDPGTTRSVYQELIEGENVDLTVGIFGSENLLAILPNIAQNDVLHLSTGAATPEATRKVSEDYDRFKTYFRVGPVNSNFLGQSMVQFAGDMFDEMGWQRVAFVAEDFKWTQPLSDIVPGSLQDEVAADVVVNQRISEGTEDFTPVYDELESEDVDGAFTALAHIGSVSLVQWAKQARPFGYGGIHVPAQLVAYYDAVEGAAESVFTQTSATPRTELTDKTVPYAEAFNERFESFPVYSGFISSDAMELFRIVAEEANSTSGEDLVPLIEDISYVGTTGTVEFYGRDHEFTHDVKFGREFVQPVYIQWQAGEQEVLWPPRHATSSYQPPVWL